MDPPRRPTLGRSKSFNGSPSPRAPQRSILDDITDIIAQYPAAALARRPNNPIAPNQQVQENNSQPNHQRRPLPPLLRITSAPDVLRDGPSSPTTSSSPVPLLQPRAPPLRRRRSHRDPSPSPIETGRRELGVGVNEGIAERRRIRRFSPMRREEASSENDEPRPRPRSSDS